jgi:hypothetical protein
MAKDELPGPLAKRELLHSDKPVECQKYGDMFFERERFNDAIDFYAMGNLKDGLRKVKQVAIDEGDYFLLKRLKGFLPDEVAGEDWEKLAKMAQSKGKANFAKWADQERGKRGANGGHEGEEP